MQLWTAIEQGLEQIHYDSRFTAYLIVIRNYKRKFARGRLLSQIFSKYQQMFIQKAKMAEKVKKIELQTIDINIGEQIL